MDYWHMKLSSFRMNIEILWRFVLTRLSEFDVLLSYKKNNSSNDDHHDCDMIRTRNKCTTRLLQIFIFTNPRSMHQYFSVIITVSYFCF